jgi:hypothetical protein
VRHARERHAQPPNRGDEARQRGRPPFGSRRRTPRRRNPRWTPPTRKPRPGRPQDRRERAEGRVWESVGAGRSSDPPHQLPWLP